MNALLAMQPTASLCEDLKREYWRFKFRATKELLKAEAICTHPLVVGHGWKEGRYIDRGGHYICANCRAEWSAHWGTGTAPGQTIVEPHQVGLRDMFQLRIPGDMRGHIKHEWSSQPLPKRPRRARTEFSL